MLKNKIKTFSVLALVSVLAISLSLFGLSLDKPSGFVFAAEAETSSSEESTTENPTETVVAKINEETYDSLSAAVEAATAGDTVVLISDIELDEQVATGKAITIDGQGKYAIKATKKIVGANSKAGMFYRTTSAQGTLTFKNVTLDGNGVSKIFLNEGGAGETVFDGVTSKNGGGIDYGSGIHISGGGSHATIKNSTLTGSTGNYKLSEANYYAANDLWVGGNVYVTVENSTIGYVFVNSAPSATPEKNIVHGRLTIIGEDTKITYLSGEEEKTAVDKDGRKGSLVTIENGFVETIFDMGDFAISGGTFKTELKQEWLAEGFAPVKNGDDTYGVAETVAKVGENDYASLAEAIAAAKAGETVTLVTDTAENVTIGKDLTLDLGDYTLSSGSKDVVLTVVSGNVVINAVKGGIRGGSGSNNVAVMVTEGNLTINGGNYYVGGDKNGEGNSTIYIAGKGNVTINGGNFETEKSWNNFYYVLNIQNDKTGTFIVKGGRFINYNPANGDDKKGGNFVAEGYNLFKKTWPDSYFCEVFKEAFKVTDSGVGHVGYYDTLEEAIKATPKGGYIWLANNYDDTASAHVYDLTDKRLELNSHTLYCNSETVFVGKNARISWGEIVSQNGSAINIGKDGYVTDDFELSILGLNGGVNICNATNVVFDGCRINNTVGYAVMLCGNSTATFTDWNANFIDGKNGMFACEKGSALKIENYRSGYWKFGNGKFFVNLGGELMVSSNAKGMLEENYASLVANYRFVETETEGYYSVIEKSTLKDYLVNLGQSLTLKISVNEVGANVKVTYAYGDDEVEIAKHTDGFYYIENITPQIIDRVYIVKVYDGETIVDSKELSVLGYCDALLSSTESETAKAAVKALVFYGKAAKEYLGMTDTEAINEVIANHNLTADELAKPENSATSTGEALISKVTLNVSDVNAIVYAMTAEAYATVYDENSNYTVTIGDKEVAGIEWVASGDLYVYTGAGIYASELGKQVEVVIKNGEETVQTLVYGVYDYCSNKWTTDGISGIAKAIYAYGVACAAYVA